MQKGLQNPAVKPVVKFGAGRAETSTILDRRSSISVGEREKENSSLSSLDSITYASLPIPEKGRRLRSFNVMSLLVKRLRKTSKPPSAAALVRLDDDDKRMVMNLRFVHLPYDVVVPKIDEKLHTNASARCCEL
jgi:hypothetical protein